MQRLRSKRMQFVILTLLTFDTVIKKNQVPDTTGQSKVVIKNLWELSELPRNPWKKNMEDKIRIYGE